MQQLLGDLSVLARRCNDADKRIYDRAVERDGEVSAKLDELRGQALSDDGVAKEYHDLVLERGKLAKVIGLAVQRIAA